jgi:outer membrane protein TolC
METATKKEGLPSIGIGLDYIFVENRAIDNLADNGKDIIMPMVSVSIPLFSKKYSSKQKQLQLDQKAIESSKTTATNQLNMLFETALANLKTAKASVETQNKNISQANQAEKVLLAAYQVAKIDFDQILEIQKQH